VKLRIPESEYEIVALRASGPGGQNVQKVSSAVQLRFDIRASSLPEAVKAQLLGRRDARITRAGVLVIRAERHRSFAANRADAIARLGALVEAAGRAPKPRRPTRPSRAARERRLEEKRARSEIKALRAGRLD
jgi:ribosome-associated protein